MKLVEILAKELKEWPEVPYGCEYITQDSDGALNSTDSRQVPTLVGLQAWSANYYLDIPGTNDTWVTEVADDFSTAIVTRDMWKAERKRIAEPRKRVCMRLVELLAIELEYWPEGDHDIKFLTQDINGHVTSWEDDGPLYFDGTEWNIKGSLPVADDLVNHVERASDYSTSTVTRDMWEAERKRIIEPITWNGEGLPPVGTLIEWLDGNLLVKVEVVGIYQGAVVAVDPNSPSNVHIGKKPQYRPIQSDREKWIIVACREVESATKQYNTNIDCSSAIRMTIEAIYDTGLAKLSENK